MVVARSTVICGEDLAIGSKEARQMFPDPRCRTQQLWIPNGGLLLPVDGQDGWSSAGVGANVIRKEGKNGSH